LFGIGDVHEHSLGADGIERCGPKSGALARRHDVIKIEPPQGEPRH